MTSKEKIAPLVQQLITARSAELAQHENEIWNLSRPLLRLVHAEEEDYSTLGNCRIGGTPDLPKDMDYPVKNGKYYRFIGQLNFAELPDTLEILPEKGILFLFCGDPFENESHCFYYDAAAELENKQPPLDMECLDPYQEDDGDFVAHKIAFELSYQIGWSDDLVDFELTEEPTDKPFDTHVGGTAFGGDTEGLYALLKGFDMLRDTVLFLEEPDQETYWIPQKRGLVAQMEDKINNPEKYNTENSTINIAAVKESLRQLLAFDENRAEHRKHFKDVFCLFSLESRDEFNMWWSDNGFLNFFMLKEDLVKRNFGNVVVEVASS